MVNNLLSPFVIVKYSLLTHEVGSGAVTDANKELDCSVPPITIDPSQFNGSLHKAKDATDSNCWSSPSGKGFVIRGKTYLKDNCKVGFAFLPYHWPVLGGGCLLFSFFIFFFLFLFQIRSLSCFY